MRKKYLLALLFPAVLLIVSRADEGIGISGRPVPPSEVERTLDFLMPMVRPSKVDP